MQITPANSFRQEMEMSKPIEHACSYVYVQLDRLCDPPSFQELECPVCMDISRPPIYQCEEGHLICSACKPLLTHCPHCAKSYSNPVIRCRFAEKLSEKYFRMVEEDRQSSVPKERDVVDLLK